ncbi:MAG TPA: hypothetical protein VJA25_03265 [Dehalococcoidia bacterium]|nr:hypothetical protein [Dehalococcoidia bacterium]
MTRNYWIVALIFLALVAMVACSQASPKPSDTSKSTDTSKATEVAAQGQSAPTSKPADPSFMDIMNSGKQAAYKVTYQISGTSSGQKMSGEQTLFVKPPKTRMDFPGSEGGGAGRASLYMLPDSTVMCSMAAVPPLCLKMPKAQAMQQNQGVSAQEQVQESPDKFDVSYQGTRDIAGQQGQCFALKPKGGSQAGFTEGTFCYTKQGALLLMESKSQGSEMKMEATSFSTSVSDADFQLPAEPGELPGIPLIPGGLGGR